MKDVILCSKRRRRRPYIALQQQRYTIMTKVQTKQQVPNYKRVASDTHYDQNWHPSTVNSFMTILQILLPGQDILP